MPSYAQSQLNTDVIALSSGTFKAAKFLTIANQAVQDVLADIDMRSMKRKATLAPNLFDDIFAYGCASDMKGLGIIDVQPQVRRGQSDDWELVTLEEFDRYKLSGRNLIAIDRRDFVDKLMISKPIDDTEAVIDSLDAVGDWEGFGGGGNITADADNYVKGSANLNWDIDATSDTTAGIQNTSLSEFDVSDYKTTGSAFVWAYASSVTNLTNYILRIGSSSSAYYYITITTNNEGNAFETGWNLLRFDFANKSTTGTPDDDACDYVALYMTKDTAKISETDYRFDNLVLKLGEHHWVRYYSKYGWQTSTGTYLENATVTTDVLNVDTDEYTLIRLKTQELMERHLKQSNLADGYLKNYELKRAEYQLKNPSEALSTIQTYYDM